MKKGFLKILTAGLVLSASAGLVGCTIEDPKSNSINYSFYNYDNTYNLNDIFSIEGAKLKITKEDGSTEEIVVDNSMIKQMPDMSTAGTKTIIIVYQGVEYQLTIEVIEAEDPVTIVSSNFSGFKSEYEINEVFDISNLKLNLNLSDGTNSQISVTANMIVTMPDMSTEGTKTVVVSYNNTQFTFSFNVKNSSHEEMLAKLQDFMKKYNSNTVKNSSININAEGFAKYLQNSVEFNDLWASLHMSNVLNLEGYEISKIGNTYVFTKNFDTFANLLKGSSSVSIDLINTDYVVVLTCTEIENYVREYGTTTFEKITNRINAGEVLEKITFEEFKNTIILSDLTRFYSGEDAKSITVFNSIFAQPIYKAIINAIVNSTTNIQKSDILSSNENLTAKLDIIKTLNSILTNVSNVDFYNMFVNDILLPEENSVYAELVTTYITKAFKITDQNTLDELNYAISKDIRKLRNNQLSDLETAYNMIIELNNILQSSNGDTILLDKINQIVSEIDNQDKHMISKFIYSCKKFASISSLERGESADLEYINSLDICNKYEKDGIYHFTYYKEVEGQDELIETYYSSLKSIIEKFENIKDYTSVKTFANDIITDLRAMDSVNKVIEDNGYFNVMIDIGATATVRIAVQYYIDIYDAEVIKNYIDILALAQPEGSIIYEVANNNMSPTIVTGDTVLIEASETYNVGDIIAYKEQEDTVISEIIRIEGAQYICTNNTSSNKAVSKEEIIGAVTEINPLYFGLNENLITALRDCSNIIYSALKTEGNIDYVKLIEDLCERLNVEKDYYIEQYNAGSLTLFTDLFEMFVPNWDYYTGAKLEINTAYRNICMYLDSLFVETFDRTVFIEKINQCLTATLNMYSETYSPTTKLVLDCLIKITNTTQDLYANIRDIVAEYKSTAKDYIEFALIMTLNLDSENLPAVNALEDIIDYHLTSYIKNELVLSDMLNDLNTFMDRYCDLETNISVKAGTILGLILMGQDKDVDYNQIFNGIELPAEIKEVDFNKLINETLRDKNTYNILSLQDVKVDYITDTQGKIIKEVLTVSLQANYDILLSSMDATVTLVIEIDF